MPNPIQADAVAFLEDPFGHLEHLRRQAGTRALDLVADLVGQLDIDGPARKTVGEKLLTMLAEWYCERVPAHRGDWLFAQQQAALALNALFWVARLHLEGEVENRGRSLGEFASRFAAAERVGRILNPPDLRTQADEVIMLVLEAIRYLRSVYDGAFEVGGEGKLVTFDEDPQRIGFWPPDPVGDDVKGEVVEEVAQVVACLPGSLGVLLTGSFASPARRDRFSDLDLMVLLEERPSDATHQSVVEALSPEKHGAFGDHLYVSMRGAGMHLEFGTRRAQDRYFESLETTGDQLPYVHWACELFAISAYQWSIGRVLADDSGAMTAYQERARHYPEAFRVRMLEESAAMWRDSSAQLAEATGSRDDLVMATSLCALWEAVVRRRATLNRVHVNPHAAKWMVIELAEPEPPADLQTSWARAQEAWAAL